MRDHDLHDIAREFPDLTISSQTDEAALREIETKYNLRIQIADQSLRDRELTLKEKAAESDRWKNPLIVGVAVGALSLFGTFVNGFVSNKNQHALEKVRLQNELIKDAMKPANPKERANSLVFFAQNGLIDLEPKALTYLKKITGEEPIPGSSSSPATQTSNAATGPMPLSFSDKIVARIVSKPGVEYPVEHLPAPASVGHIKAIVLHASYGPDAAIKVIREGLPPNLPGPLAHWAVQTDGKLEFIAPEDQVAYHVGRADKGLTNRNTIGIEASGLRAFENERQVETLVRLVADIADRWSIPTDQIFSHAEVAMPTGRKTDMLQQAPVIRRMVDAVRMNK